MKKIQLTQEGFEKLQKEYQDLKERKRPAAVERLQKARAMGDLSENSEYSAAKEGLALVEGRILELETILKNVEITNYHTHGQMVEIGNTVEVEHEGEKSQFLIVGEFEADPLKQKLSQNSPIGKSLLGKKIGEVVEVQTPAGKKIYKITNIK
ncbi:MAG: transcription elongation factor GreA [Candidatus Roizmanbacteria bacterium]|nr:MAG: transcription elongation factor GreA [Candidatus Roizmanbacteria bacterium]